MDGSEHIQYLEKYFDPKTWTTMSSYERLRYCKIYKNYLEMISCGIDIPKPEFLIQKEASKIDNASTIKINRKGKCKKESSEVTVPIAHDYEKLINVYDKIGDKGFSIKEMKFSKKKFETISEIADDLEIRYEFLLKHSEKAHHIYVLKTLFDENHLKDHITPQSTNRRYPRRNIQRVDYTEVDIPDDYYIYCDPCGREWEGCFCPFHGPLLNCPDNKIPKEPTNLMRAMQTTPIDWLCIRKSAIPNAGIGVWSMKCIPTGVRFGPYEGVESVNGNDEGYCWVIRKDRRISHYIDGKPEGVSNWMRYVNCSRNITEQNLSAFQYLGKIYYRTTKNIYPQTELLIWYGEEYGNRLGIDKKSYYTPVDKKTLIIANFPCKGCHLNFSTPIYMEMHRRRCNKFRTAICNANTSTKENVTSSQAQNKITSIVKKQNNTENHPDDIRKCFVQDVLHKKEQRTGITLTSRQSISLKTHVQGVHKNERPFKCDACKASFTQSGSLKTHVQGVHKNERPFKCDECNAAFTRSDSLKTHVQGVHKNERPFKCDECNAAFTQSGSLKTHVQGVHKNERPFKCDECTAAFTQSGDLKKHVQGVHKNERPFKCDECNATFTRSDHLKTHVQGVHKNERPFKCDECNAAFTRSDSLKTHVQGVHKNERPFKCDECNAAFTQSGSLKTHVQGVHKNERPFKCDECKASFTQSGSLKTHVQGVHKNERPFKCDECNATFTRSDHLKTHVQGVHKNERPFKCDECNATFTRSGNLKTHVQGVHKNERPFKCDECNAAFTQSGDLKKHVQGVHKNGGRFK